MLFNYDANNRLSNSAGLNFLAHNNLKIYVEKQFSSFLLTHYTVLVVLYNYINQLIKQKLVFLLCSKTLNISSSRLYPIPCNLLFIYIF